jgi:hypothetical protein
MSKFWITTGLVLGSIIGGFVPGLWGDNGIFSLSSIVFNFIGGAVGLYAGFKVSQYFN